MGAPVWGPGRLLRLPLRQLAGGAASRHLPAGGQHPTGQPPHRHVQVGGLALSDRGPPTVTLDPSMILDPNMILDPSQLISPLVPELGLKSNAGLSTDPASRCS